MTNGDRIRQMSDEELAEIVELIDCKTDKVECPLYNYNVAGCSRLCKSSFLQWLKEEIEKDE